jgi:release factor glutamine methyltransferase
MKKTLFFVRDSLSGYYDSNEIEGLVFTIFNTLLGYSKYDLIVNKDIILSDFDTSRIFDIVNRLKAFEPIQYILGESYFYDLKFNVNPSVLIPRGETEELVQKIISDNKMAAPKILDIGTGSGCIAVSLKKNILQAFVDACDISESALEIAKKNATLNQAEVHFFLLDILNPGNSMEGKTWDILVSNPPYVTNAEKQLINRNVLEHEPHGALFVPDTDPLLFYRAIAEFGRKYLNQGGTVYFEINEAFGSQTRQILLDYHYQSVQIFQDIHGKNRMISAKKN